MGEAINVAGAEDKGAAQLEGIAAKFVLVVSGGAGALAALEVVAAEEVEDVGLAQVGELIGLAVLVDQEREGDAGFLLEKAGVVGVTEAYGSEGGMLLAEGLFVLAQLRDVFTAEDSTIVTEEDQDGGIRFPEAAETNGLPERVGKHDSGEPLAESFGHEVDD